MKSQAPSFIASTALSISPWPVIITTSTWSTCSLILISRSRSCTSGRRRSMIMTSNHCLRIIAMAVAASAATTTLRRSFGQLLEQEPADRFLVID